MELVGFCAWLVRQGCAVEVTQEDDGSGYICIQVTTPEGDTHYVTVTVE